MGGEILHVLAHPVLLLESPEGIPEGFGRKARLRQQAEGVIVGMGLEFPRVRTVEKDCGKSIESLLQGIRSLSYNEK